ncbi:interferon-induced very large GTPase 1-like [Paramuricea clavata]|uniref:Interferon-induced very large GTPase 1-like n=1 Tax=Paramuricea clavata TaxID=317549 RepID=A0A7D9L322_PARCT|nr:interferon-induced very large GTPase 1-like [Paramuricea clavata]
MKGGNVTRKIVDGLLELSWYLPGGSEKQTLQNEMCFVNLRGDARDFKKQRDLLLEISSVLCILLPSESPDETKKKILEEATQSKGKVIFIFNGKRKGDSKKYFDDLKSEHGEMLSLSTRTNKSNEYDFLQSIRVNLQKNIKKVEPKPLVELASYAHKYGFHIDCKQPDSRMEYSVDTWLNQGIQEAKDTLYLQMHVPTLADLGRKKYCPKRQVAKSESDRTKRDINDIDKDIQAEIEDQIESFEKMEEGILHYLNCTAVVNETERNYTLSKLKHRLDKMSLHVMAKLRQEYRVASLNLQKKRKKSQQKSEESVEKLEQNLKQLEESITKCSFGLEHIIRELAQLYQLPDIVTIDYARAAAEMLLSGHPLELLDGDSSYIPLKWFEALYRKLELKIAHKTENAKNSDSLKSDSGYDYILIIDTEGLRGSGNPQLREHDNELATFAIGMADVTLVNIFGENHNEMKEFLEIAVHAFLKMKLVKEKKKCKIIHQNVAATDAQDKLAVDRSNLKEDLDKMATVAATQENCD